MPRPLIEPVRRSALVHAAISEIGETGSLDVTVARIARRAGVSPALAHHYFGSKEQIFLAAMRHILRAFGGSVRARLAEAQTPRARVSAIVTASFAQENFAPETIAAWLNFYVYAQTVPEAKRLLSVYRRRLHANLAHALRPLAGARAGEIAEIVGALIDGFYIRQALHGAPVPGSAEIVALIERTINRLLSEE